MSTFSYNIATSLMTSATFLLFLELNELFLKLNQGFTYGEVNVHTLGQNWTKNLIGPFPLHCMSYLHRVQGKDKLLGLMYSKVNTISLSRIKMFLYLF